MRKPTTHKIITYGVLVLCVVAAVYVFYKWGQGVVMDAPQMLTPIATIAVVDIAQYAGKSGYDHKHGVFDNPITTAAISGMGMGDVGSAVSQVVQAVHDQHEAEESQSDASNADQGQNSNMAG